MRERRRSGLDERIDLTEADNRDRAGDDRDRAAGLRDQAGNDRDVLAELRDQAGDVRDTIADERDDASEERDGVADRRDAMKQMRSHTDRGSDDDRRLERHDAASDRAHSATDRISAADERRLAGQDREAATLNRVAGAVERGHAEHDRESASADRAGSEKDRGYSALDGLTGAYVRSAGVLALDREIARARRLQQTLTVAFVDVDGLKQTNDLHGHAAGDHLLILVAEMLRSKLRSYDIVVRYGGDEFVCVVAGLQSSAFVQRFSLIHDELAGVASISVGFAELTSSDSSHSLLARADTSMYQNRRDRRTARSD